MWLVDFHLCDTHSLVANLVRVVVVKLGVVLRENRSLVSRPRNVALQIIQPCSIQQYSLVFF